MAPRLAQQRGSLNVDGRSRITIDGNSLKILTKKYFPMTIKAIFCACEVAYQTIYGLVHFVWSRSDDVIPVPCSGVPITDNDD
eukprot:15992886-Heterocapsa_arctica.AAC.1